MANTFKLVTSDGSAVTGGTERSVYTAPASTTTVIVGLTLSNLTGSTTYVTVNIYNADGDDVKFLKDVPIPTGSAVEVMSGNKVILNTGDELRIISSVDNSVDCTMSIMEIA